MNQELMIKMVLDAWHQYLKRTDAFFKQLSEQDFMKQVAPGKNSARYLLGHLTAVHDRMIPLLGLGEQLAPELVPDFEQNPDGAQVERYKVGDLLVMWERVNHTLNKALAALTTEQWFQKHTAVSEEDFKNEPHRNRLNVIINRTNHLAWHYGQLLLIKDRG